MVRWEYNGENYAKETIEGLAGQYLRELEEVILHCVQRGKEGGERTPGDYGLSGEVSRMRSWRGSWRSGWGRESGGERWWRGCTG